LAHHCSIRSSSSTDWFIAVPCLFIFLHPQLRLCPFRSPVIIYGLGNCCTSFCSSFLVGSLLGEIYIVSTREMSVSVPSCPYVPFSFDPLLYHYGHFVFCPFGAAWFREYIVATEHHALSVFDVGLLKAYCCGVRFFCQYF
jgi:hypothetical protein